MTTDHPQHTSAWNNSILLLVLLKTTYSRIAYQLIVGKTLTRYVVPIIPRVLIAEGCTMLLTVSEGMQHLPLAQKRQLHIQICFKTDQWWIHREEDWQSPPNLSNNPRPLYLANRILNQKTLKFDKVVCPRLGWSASLQPTYDSRRKAKNRIFNLFLL